MSKNTKTVKAAAKPAAKKACAKPAEKKAPVAKAAPAKAAKAAKAEKPAVEKKPAAKAAAPKAAPKAAAKAPAKKAAPAKAAKKIAVVLTTPTAYELASKVTVAGSFNEWNQATACKKDKKTGLWSAKLSLAAGTYQYKFICDDQYWDEGDNKIVEVK